MKRFVVTMKEVRETEYCVYAKNKQEARKKAQESEFEFEKDYILIGSQFKRAEED